MQQHVSKPAAHTVLRKQDEKKKPPMQAKAAENHSGLPDGLKAGIENLSGLSMDDVKVHRNSSKPAQLQAHAYAQGSDIHLAPGQDKHLPHEAWHVVQQKQGRVQATAQLKSNVPVNTDLSLEKEADQMGSKAASGSGVLSHAPLRHAESGNTVQRVPEWLQSLINLAKEHPVGTTATVVIGAGTLLGYYYYKQSQKKQPQQNNHVEDPQEEEEPDWETIEGVAQAIGKDPHDLLQQLEHGTNNNVSVNDAYGKGFNPAQHDGKGLIPPSILANLSANPDTAVGQIFARINNFTFVYNGYQSSGYRGFLEHTGDCATLRDMFCLAAKAAGIAVQQGDDDTAMLVDSRPMHGRPTQGNTAGSLFWFFHDHHWATHNGTHFDLLFMTNAQVPPHHRTAADVVHNGIKYDIFNNNRAMIHASECAALNIVLQPGQVGYVLPLNQVQAFIDEHKK
ncbi:MAG: eCIS core domain-containing protein [Flavobacteriales bacterium]